MNRKITFQDLREFDFRHVWELSNPKFAQAPEGSNEALPQFKRRHGGGPLRVLTDHLTPSRLYGVRKLLAWPLWLFNALLIAATVAAYLDGSFNMGQVYMTLFFVGIYLLFFLEAAKFRISNWVRVYTKAVKTDLGTHTPPTIIFDGRDMLLGNDRLFEAIGERPIAAFIDDYQDQLRHKEKLQAEAKKAAEKEKARAKKQKENEEFKAAVKDLGGIAASGLAAAARASKNNQQSNNNQSTGSASSKPNYVKIEGYTGTYWETCATGLENNSNYISTRIKQIRKSNPRYTKLRAVDSNGRVVDMG